MITEKHYPVLLVVLSSILFFFALGFRDFWAPVEPRYAEIVRVMFAKGEWIVPTINGGLYTDKPMLFFWLALIASKLFGGVSDWTVRFPAALGGVAATTRCASFAIACEFAADRRRRAGGGLSRAARVGQRDGCDRRVDGAVGRHGGALGVSLPGSFQIAKTVRARDRQASAGDCAVVYLCRHHA